MYEELEERLLNCDSIESLENLQQYLITIDTKNNNDIKILNDYKTIISTIITHQYLSLAANNSKSNNLHLALQYFKKVNVNTSNFSILLFYEYSYNYGITLSKILSKEQEGLIKLYDALNIVNTLLPESLANLLFFKTKKAIIIANYNLSKYADALSHIDEYLELISVDNTRGGSEEEYEILCAKATILFEIGEYSRTITVSSKAVTLNPNRGEGYYIRGSAKEKLYMKKEAFADYSNVHYFNASTNRNLIESKSEILNLSSLVKLDSYESFLLPTSLLPGHITFDSADVIESDTNKYVKPNLCYEEENISSFSLNLRSPIKNQNISENVLSPIISVSRPHHKSPIALKTPKSNAVIGDRIPNRKNDTCETPKHTALDDNYLKHSKPVMSSILIDKATTNLKAFFDSNKVEGDRQNFCIEEPLSLSVAKPERHNPNNNTDLTYSIEELTFPGPYPRDVDIQRRELYLNDYDFKQLLGCTKDEWKSVPPWKKVDLKKKFALF